MWQEHVISWQSAKLSPAPGTWHILDSDIQLCVHYLASKLAPLSSLFLFLLPSFCLTSAPMQPDQSSLNRSASEEPSFPSDHDRNSRLYFYFTIFKMPIMALLCHPGSFTERFDVCQLASFSHSKEKYVSAAFRNLCQPLVSLHDPSLPFSSLPPLPLLWSDSLSSPIIPSAECFSFLWWFPQCRGHTEHTTSTYAKNLSSHKDAWIHKGT